MNNSQDSQEWQALLADYVLGEVTSEEAETVHQLLRTHPELQEELIHLQETLALIPLTLPESSPPKYLKMNILHLAKMGVENTSVNAIVTSLHQKSRLQLLALGTIAVALLVGLGWSNYRLQQQLAIAQSELSAIQTKIATISALNHRLMSLKGTTKAPQATGVVVIIPGSNKAIMTINNLPPLPAGKVYRLWAIVNGKPFECGQFNVDKNGQMMKQMPLDSAITNNSKLLITIESVEAVLQPTGSEVMTSQI